MPDSPEVIGFNESIYLYAQVIHSLQLTADSKDSPIDSLFFQQQQRTLLDSLNDAIAWIRAVVAFK